MVNDSAKHLIGRLLSVVALQVLPPHEAPASEPRERLLREMIERREQVFRRLYPNMDKGKDEQWSDRRAWHVIATQRSDGSVVGAVRLFVMPRHSPSVSLEELRSACGVAWSTPEEGATQSLAFEKLLCRSPHESRFLYVGPLFAVDRWQHRLGALLGLAANALARNLECRLGLAMVTTRDGAGELFMRFCGYRLDIDGVPVPPFYCPHHGEICELLGLDPLRSEPALENAIETLRGMLGKALV